MGKSVEVGSLRGESRDVYATPDGNLEAREYLRPVRARVEGKWQPVDTELVKTSEGSVAPKVATVGLEFSAGGDARLVRMTKAGRELALSWPGKLPVPELDGSTATYRNVLPDVDLRMGAQEDGFTQLLVVKSAEAAASEELAELRLKLGTDGMEVRETFEGGLEAIDQGAKGAVFEAPEPLMWDSSTRAEPTAGTAAAKSLSATAADADGEPAAGESGKLAPVGVDVASSGELVLTPDADVLLGEDTTYPVFIDPQWHAPRASAWTMASKYWASSPQWKFNGESNAGMGYCGWAYCQPHDTKRLFYRIPVSTFAGKSILSAEFVVRNVWSASCNARGVQLWRTKDISTSTTWNSQDNSDFWIDHLKTQSFAYGYDGCAAKDAEFDVKAAVQQAANGKWSTMTFGMRAGDEGDAYGWKRFSDKAFLRVKYNRPPSQIRTSQLVMDPGGTCVKADKMRRVRTLPTLRALGVTDPDGDDVSVQFRASWDAGDGRKPHWTPGKSTFKKSGSDFSLKPSRLPANKTIVWEARSYDGAQWSPWSSVNANGCYVMYDTGVPAGPSITSTHYPASDPEDPDDPWWDGVGRYGVFTIDSASSDVTKYWFGVNGDPTSKHTLTTSGGGAKTMKFMPTKPGPNFITAQAFDSAGNGSEVRTYYFRVRAGQPDRLTWGLDESPGADSFSGSGGAWPADLHGGATPGGDGVTGNGLHFDGLDDRAATVSPVLNTRKSFSVSLRAKLGELDPSHGAVAVAQAGSTRSAFELYFSPSRNGWVFARHSADAENATASRAMQPACASGDTSCTSSRLGRWTHVVGVFDNPNSQVKLYVDGKLVGTAAYSTLWDARGGTLLGATETARTPNGFFSGDLDEVQIFDYQLTGADVTRLHSKQPVDSGTRPAKVVWLMEDDPNATAVTGRAQKVTATVHGRPAFGGAGVAGTSLHLDGSDDYATTAQPVLDTYQSFSVSLWARLPADKENRAMTAVSQAGSINAGFDLYHSSALGGWVFAREESNESTSAVVRAEQNACPSSTPNCAAARLGQWSHVVGVYDYDAGQIRLYVDGVLKSTEAFTTPWLATGPVTLGHTLTPGGPGSLFKGDLDKVRMYDRTISDDEVRQLFRQNPVVKGRWKFEDASDSTPPTTPDDSAEKRALTLGGGAKTGLGWVDDGALELDGINDHAVTATSPIDTGASFTVMGWAQSAGVPTDSAAVLSALGVSNSAFAIRHVPAAAGGAGAGHWQVSMPNSDAADATVVRTENQQFYDARDWNHLALVYDGFAREARLYVNGQEEIACADADGDGESDDATCADRFSWSENVLSYKATGGLQIGRAKTAGAWGEYWPGAVDDVWVFQGALSESQVAHLSLGMPGVATEVPGTD
ncbi:LamG-like jellyroll fold domain-containing protein [Streptomyces sp. DG2A-72]|uniref:LamG-like jellyroll fold domain-containing protein n=1 Tax=Streptomyces sp. DG2A-72 TaxID=3051386 RepID=UPI00346449F4